MSTKKEEQKQDSRSSSTTNPQEAKSRKDAATIAKKLETIVEEKEGKKYTVDQQSHAMIKALDGSKDNINQGINEAKAEIPRFTQIVKDFQETAIESTKEISDAFIESQRQLISSLQSVWIPSLVDLYGTIRNYWKLQPIISDIYVSMVRITADNVIATTRLANNIIFTNIEAAKALMPQLKDNAKELLRLSENAAKSFEQTSRRALNPD
ncbi:MAG: hypothetical protein M3P08_00825 [Thermoproteota archaeon]|jgi:hypothetical protein|nr:hypothetical protein [Thermoproteota archaeon]